VASSPISSASTFGQRNLAVTANTCEPSFGAVGAVVVPLTVVVQEHTPRVLRDRTQRPPAALDAADHVGRTTAPPGPWRAGLWTLSSCQESHGCVWITFEHASAIPICLRSRRSRRGRWLSCLPAPPGLDFYASCRLWSSITSWLISAGTLGTTCSLK
jgi:hypothetical protein